MRKFYVIGLMLILMLSVAGCGKSAGEEKRNLD